jgi:hypothetical protein
MKLPSNEEARFRRTPTVWLVLVAVALMLAAARCGRDVRLGVDPDSGAAAQLDGGTG